MVKFHFLEMKLSSDHEEVNSKFYAIDRIRRNIKNETISKSGMLSEEEMDILKQTIQHYIPLPLDEFNAINIQV